MSGSSPSSAGARITARGWGFRYAGRRAPAVRDFDIEVAPGERVLLLGASGGGKSTLLRALAGVLGGDESGDETGVLQIDGGTPTARRGVAGLVLQDPETQVILPRVGDDVAFGAESLGVPAGEIAGRVRDALALVGLAVPLDRPTSALSGGQKQRLALAGVLAMRPGLLLLDEPTANLDPDGARAVRDAVVAAAAATGATLLVVEHRVAIWQDVVDRVVVLGPDGVLADGPPTRVLGARGAALAAAGVWVPGHEPESPRLPVGDAAVLATRDLVVGRGDPIRVPDLEVRGGGVLLLAGPNGSGKTSTLLALGGLTAPSAGTVTASAALARGLGPAPIRWRPRDLPPRIGSVLQSPQLQFLRPTVRQEVQLGAGRDAARVDAMLERVGLAALADANPFTLSGGQQRRLTVAAALAGRPAVLLLDEPTFGQDTRTWAALVDLLAAAVADGTAVAAATHDERLLAAADRVLQLDPVALPA